MPQPSWSPSTTQQLRKLVAAPYLAPNDWTPRSEAYFVFPLAQGTPGKQCGLAATGVYQPSLRSPWLAAMEIEGERLDRESVVNSIAALMGFLPGKGLAWDKKAEGVARLMTDVRQHWNQPLTHNLLFAWQQAVVPESYLYNINRGAYRDDEMQIVSGGVGHYKVHYEAPPPDRVEVEMDHFIDWYNATQGRLPGPVRAGVAHLWFEVIHPFDDGNGRVGRAIADQALSQD
ncbi:Fic family protein, partial [Thiolapillus sp.]|uniref:Fic family protein n=4 Tax=Thiolapillus sp. TaxID=2017437 RepID=UPI003AF51E71